MNSSEQSQPNCVDLTEDGVKQFQNRAKTIPLCGPEGHLQAEDDEGFVEYKWRLTGIAPQRLQHLVTQMQFRVLEGNGRCLYELGVADNGRKRGLGPKDFDESVQTIRRMAEELHFDVKVLHEEICGYETWKASEVNDVNAEVARLPLDVSNGTDVPESDGFENERTGKRGAIPLRCAELLVMRREDILPVEGLVHPYPYASWNDVPAAGLPSPRTLRITFCGASGTGKSTLMGALIQGTLDNGSGRTRQAVFNHKHELDSGHTSSLSCQLWEVEDLLSTPQMSPCTQIGSRIREEDGALPSFELPPAARGPASPTDKNSPHSVMLMDLGGAEKYSHTTYFGMTSRPPAYLSICLSAVAPGGGPQSAVSLRDSLLPFVRMAQAMHVSCFVIVTKSDAVDELDLESLQFEALEALSVGCQCDTFPAETTDDVLIAVEHCVRNGRIPGEVHLAEERTQAPHRTIPILSVSSVTGTGMEVLKRFLGALPELPDPQNLLMASTTLHLDGTPCLNSEVLLDGAFVGVHDEGRGMVLHGYVAHGKLSLGMKMFVGPDADGYFFEVSILGIHVKGAHVGRVRCGMEASFAISDIPNEMEFGHKGKVLLCHIPSVYRCFDVEVQLVYESTKQTSFLQLEGQEPVMHCRNIRQVVSIENVLPAGAADCWPETHNNMLLTGTEGGIMDRGILHCRLKFRPEVLYEGCIVMLCWHHNAKLVGTVRRCYPLTNEEGSKRCPEHSTRVTTSGLGATRQGPTDC